MIRDGQQLIDWLTAKIDAEKAKANGHAPRARDLGDVPDAEILEKCRTAKNAAKFEALYDRGDISGHDGDDDSASGADFALLGILKHYTQDPDQLDRIMRGSALARARYDERRGPKSWLRYSIDNALANLGDVYDWDRQERGRRVKSPSSSSSPLREDDDDDGKKGPPKVFWFAEMGDPKPREFLVADVVPKYYPTTIYGEGGVAKSLIAALLGITVSSKHAGGLWLGLPVKEHGTVVYLDFELDADEQHRRVRDLCAGLEIPVPRRLAYVSGRGERTEDAFKTAYDLGKAHSAKMGIIDSFGLAMTGDMVSSTDVLAFVRDYIDPMCAAGMTPFIVDHIAKAQAGEDYQSKTAYGSVYKHNTVRSALQVQGGKRDKEAGTLNVRVRHHKTNFGFQRDPFDTKLYFAADRIEVEAVELDDTELLTEGTLHSDDRVLLAMQDGPAYAWEIAARTGLSEGTVKNCLTRLRRQGKIKDTGETDGKARQVALASSSSSSAYRDDDDDDGKTDPETVAEFLADPPDWAAHTIRNYRAEPHRFLQPLCTAVAAAVLGKDAHWEEVVDEVRKVLG